MGCAPAGPAIDALERPTLRAGTLEFAAGDGGSREIGLLAIGLVLYLHATRARDRTGNIVLWSFLIVLVTLWAGTIFGPPPPNDRVLAWSALSIWLTVPWVAWADHHRKSA